jgi:hypothetical protein
MEGSSPTPPSTPPAPPQAAAQRSGWGVAVPVLLMLLLLGIGAVASFFALLFPWASANCTDADTHPICSTDGQTVLVLGPMAAAAIGAALAMVSCVRWPRFEWAFWMIGGYSVTVIGFFLFYGIASSAP